MIYQLFLIQIEVSYCRLVSVYHEKEKVRAWECLWDVRNSYKSLDKPPEDKTYLEDLSLYGNIGPIIKLNLKQMGFEVVG
jgi:hypothetical protein